MSAKTARRVQHLRIPTLNAWDAAITWEEQGTTALDIEIASSDGMPIPANHWSVRTEECSATRFRRVTLEGLTPDTAYTFRLLATGMRAGSIAFRTLAVPQGKRLARIAVVSDPHLTRNKTLRRGRLLGLSFRIFSSVLETIRNEEFDVLAIPGDLADKGDEEAYAFAREQLGRLTIPRLILPGNQDSLAMMKKYFPEIDSLSAAHCHGCTLVGIDTSQGRIESSLVSRIEAEIQRSRGTPTLAFTHYALALTSDFVKDTAIPIRNSALKGVWGVFSGHKNAVHATRIGQTIHVTCPQIVHYPCAWSVIEVYEEGLMVWMRQIDDLRLISLSRSEGERWIGDRWSEIRLGALASRSFVHVPN
ncbi:MAG: metallophosphoesterase [bacterium]